MHSFSQFLLEYDRDKTVASLGSKFHSRMEKDPDLKKLKVITKISEIDADLIVRSLEKADPTSNKQYVQWLVKAYVNGSRLEDLVSRGHDSLIKFETLKKKKLLPADKTDIGRLGNLDDLEALVDSIDLPKEELKDKGKSTELVNNDEVRVLIPLDEAAACYYGQGTKWCTAAKSHNMFREYYDSGFLIVLIPKHPTRPGEKYQIHFQEDQWMNEKDQAASQSYFKRRFPSVDFKKLQEQTRKSFEALLIKKLEVGTFNARDVFDYAYRVIQDRWPEAEPYIMKNPKHAYKYARWVIGGPWPEAEPYIMKDPEWAYYYAYSIIKGRWPEAEPCMMANKHWWREYQESLNKTHESILSQ